MYDFNEDDYYDWDDEEFEREQQAFFTRWCEEEMDRQYREQQVEPIAYCPDCDAPWYALEGFCGGCA